MNQSPNHPDTNSSTLKKNSTEKGEPCEQSQELSPWKKEGRAAWLFQNLPDDMKPSSKRKKLFKDGTTVPAKKRKSR